jgi:putative ABC transport system permease protein
VIGVLTLARALIHRLGTTVVILIVALCASAAATVGPTYFAAAKHSILQDSLSDADVIGRSIQISQQGAVQNTLGAVAADGQRELVAAAGSAATVRRLFAPPVEALETTAFFPAHAQNVLLVTRTDVCAHLRFSKGGCPTATNSVVVSTSLAAGNHWAVGDQIHPAGRRPLTISGIYVPPNVDNTYWLARGTTYFPHENPARQVPPYDALFTPPSTIAALSGNPQGTDVIARRLVPAHIRPADVATLERINDRLTTSQLLARTQATVTTAIGGTMQTVQSSWTALSVPVFVVTAELLVLTWLLLFLVVTDAVEARGTEIALAKLRGFGSGRSLRFGLGEPAVLLAIALPVGAVLGWLLTGGLGQVLLRPGTPVGLPVSGWLGAVVASVGGIAAIVVAARRTLTRPVVEQWRRTGRRATDRGWVFDAVVLTGAVAGLVQLAVSGTLNSTKHSALALLVPGLLGIAMAVVASRLLPLVCRATFARTRRGGGLGPFLAVRHMARRPGGTRTTMILATAIALATFSLASWSVGNSNRSRVADMTVGAPTVFTVIPKSGQDLGAVVDRIDPDGHSAAAVEDFTSAGTSLLAVQPQRFARVANWSASNVADPARMLSSLHPPAPDPIPLNGDKVRLRVDIAALEPAGGELVMNVVAQGATAPTPVDLGPLAPAGTTRQYVGELPGPSTIKDLEVSPLGGRPVQVHGDLTFSDLEVHNAGGWRRLPALAAPGQWSDTQDQRVTVTATGNRLHWSFDAVSGITGAISVHDRPDPLPAVVSTALAANSSTVSATGLNGAGVTVAVAGHAANVPSAPSNGVIVDLTYAQRAAAGNTAPATAQVWVRGPADHIHRALTAAGVVVVGEQSSSSLDDEFGRQGPGLASVLFLADAAAAAVLAALAAVLSLSAAARRRRYEYAALAATGATNRSLYGALAIEQLVVVGFGAVTGVVAGLIAIALAGHNVPEFVTSPTSSLLRYRPDILFLGLTLGGAVVLLLAAAAAAAAALLRSVNPEQLREAPS